MTLFSILKRDAKRALRGNWGGVTLALLILGGTWLALYALQSAALYLLVDPVYVDPSFAARYGFSEYFFEHYAQTDPLELCILTAFTVIELLILAPLSFGLIRWFWRLTKGERPPLADLFHFFESFRLYRKAVWLEINLAVRAFLWAIPFFALPSAIFGACVYHVSNAQIIGSASNALATVGILFSAALALLALVFYGAVISKYLLAAYLISEDDELSVFRAISRSAKYTRGYRFSLFWFQLSFVGWFLLCAAIFPTFYVIPYYGASMAMYGRYLIERQHKNPPQDTTREFHMEHTDDLADLPGEQE